MASDALEIFITNTNMDYPINVYYIELGKMFMHNAQWHWHEELEIDLVRSGTAVFHMGDKDYEVSAGNVILLNGRHPHSITSEDPDHCVILSILFHENFLFDSPKSFMYLKYCESLINNPNFTAIRFYNNTTHGRQSIESIQAILNINLAHEFGYELMTKSHLCNFWMHLLSEPLPSTKSKNYLQQLTDEERTKSGMLFIQENYSKALTLDDIADHIMVSKSECCRCFKRTIRLTPFEYLMQYRIFASALKMHRGSQDAQSFAVLSQSVGFNNASYYNKIFRKFLGFTPSQYLETIKTTHRDSLSPYGIPFVRM